MTLEIGKNTKMCNRCKKLPEQCTCLSEFEERIAVDFDEKMTRYLEIDRCVDCKHIYALRNICYVMSKDIPDITKIPNWCPLPMKAKCMTTE